MQENYYKNYYNFDFLSKILFVNTTTYAFYRLSSLFRPRSRRSYRAKLTRIGVSSSRSRGQRNRNRLQPLSPTRQEERSLLYFADYPNLKPRGRSSGTCRQPNQATQKVGSRARQNTRRRTWQRQLRR